MPTRTTTTRRGVGAYVELVGKLAQVREASPIDTGAALVASLSRRLTDIERRIEVQEAKR